MGAFSSLRSTVLFTDFSTVLCFGIILLINCLRIFHTDSFPQNQIKTGLPSPCYHTYFILIASVGTLSKAQLPVRPLFLAPILSMRKLLNPSPAPTHIKEASYRSSQRKTEASLQHVPGAEGTLLGWSSES